MGRSLLKIFSILIIVVNCHWQDNDIRLKDISARKVKVITTTGMIADAVRNVGKERVEVRALMGPGVDPHMYKASEGDVIRMIDADIIFYNGLHLEGKLGEVLAQLQSRVKTVAISDGISREFLFSFPNFQGNYDPHIWFDVNLWKAGVKMIEESLAELDTAHANVYQQNAEKYSHILSELNEYVYQQAQKIPAEKRVLITAHDAFNYFGRAYGLEVYGLQGLSTVAETGTADIQNLAKFIVERKIPALFVESSVPPRYIEALQAAVNARGFKVSIGGSLYSDALGTENSSEGTYVGMMRYNIDTIVKALHQ